MGALRSVIDEAIEAYKKSILLKPNVAEAYRTWVDALQDQGKFEEALDAFNKCYIT